MDAQALIDTAEGASQEIEFALQRMRDLAVQGANGTNNSDDRDNLEAEYVALKAEINRIAGSSTWAGKKLINAANTFDFLVGTGNTNTVGTDVISITTTDLDTTALALQANLFTAGGGTHAEALSAIVLIDTALTTVNTARAKLGAVSNRLDSTVKNLTNISTNLQGGRGRIEDADFAAETTNLAKS